MRWLAAAVVAALTIVGMRLVPGSPSHASAVTGVSTTAAAPLRRTETGELQAITDQTLSIITRRGPQTFRTTGRTDWREGARTINRAEVSSYRGHSIKVHFHVDDGEPVAEHVVISPERATPGSLAAYDVAAHVLSLSTATGMRRFTLNGHTSCRVGLQVVAAESLPEYIGQPVTVTTSTRTGQVTAIRVQPLQLAADR